MAGDSVSIRMSARQHEWEQIDQGERYCLNCGTISANSSDPNCMKDTPKPKASENARLPHGSKDQEIENLKRLLASVSQRLDALKNR